MILYQRCAEQLMTRTFPILRPYGALAERVRTGFRSAASLAGVPCSLRRGFCFVLCGAFIATAFTLTACIPRGAVDERPFKEQLAFLRRPDATRAQIEARLGAPSQTYEQGAVVSYPLYVEGEGQLTTLASGKNAYLTLMLHYAPDGRLIRSSLLRRP